MIVIEFPRAQRGRHKSNTGLIEVHKTRRNFRGRNISHGLDSWSASRSVKRHPQHRKMVIHGPESKKFSLLKQMYLSPEKRQTRRTTLFQLQSRSKSCGLLTYLLPWRTQGAPLTIPRAPTPSSCVSCCTDECGAIHLNFSFHSTLFSIVTACDIPRCTDYSIGAFFFPRKRKLGR